MSKESRGCQANVKFDEATYRDLEECSNLDFDRGVIGIVRKLVKKGLPALKAELIAQSAAIKDSHSQTKPPNKRSNKSSKN